MRKLFVFFLSLITSLFVVEILLHIFWKPDFLNKEYQRDDLKWISSSVVLNKFGYRDDNNYSLEKPKDIFRVYVVGDSYTYGWYIDNYKESYPEVIESVLASRATKIEVVNAARPGFDFEAYLDRLQNEGKFFAPDSVVIGVNSDDFIKDVYYPKLSRSKFIRDLYIYQLTFGLYQRRIVAKKMHQEAAKTFVDDSAKLAELKQRLISTIQIFKEFDTKFYLVIFPNIDPSNPGGRDISDGYHRQITKLALGAGAVPVDLYSAYMRVDDKRSLVLNPLDPHPTALANKIAGEELAKSIEITTPHNPTYLSRKITIGTKIGGLVVDVPDGWVFFDQVNALSTQKIFPRTTSYRKMQYLEDIITTAKSNTHSGWPGAKLAYHAPGNENPVIIPNDVYGFSILGVDKIIGYWRKSGALNSEDVDSLSVTKGKNSLAISIAGEKQYDFFKITLDLAVKQFDIYDGVVVSMFSSAFGGSEDQSLSKANYYWLGDNFVAGVPGEFNNVRVPMAVAGNEYIDVKIIKDENE